MIIRIETRKSGQPRPYADHFYEYIIRITNQLTYGEGAEVPMNLPDDQVADIVCAARNFRKKQEARSWADRIMISCTKIGEGEWMFCGTAAYTG